MAWTLEEIQAKRKEVEAEKAAMRTASGTATQSAKGSGLALSVTSGDTSPKGRGKTDEGTLSASQSASGTGSGWSAEKIQQMRAEVSAEKAAMGLVSADTVGKNVLDGMMELPQSAGAGTLTAQRGTSLNAAHEMLESTRTQTGRTPSVSASADSSLKEGAFTQGRYGELAQKAGESLSERREEEQFDKLNAWMESDEGNRELVRKLRTGKVTPYAEQSRAMQPASVSGAAASGGIAPSSVTETSSVTPSPDRGKALAGTGTQAYSDAELMAMGYTSDQIAAAKQYIAEFDALPAWKRAAQRASDSAEGVVSTVASAIPLTGEYLGQSVLNVAGTQENLQTLWQGMEGDNRERALYAYLRGTDADGNPYTDEAIQSMGYTPDEIAAMRTKIEGTYVTDGVAPEESLGYQLAQHGQGMTELAQRGLSDSGKFWLGAATSAGENLAIAAVNPYAVMPVLTAQTVADSLFESTQSGEDAGKALARAAAKGGVGWGIEQFGVEQMLEQMGAQGTVSKIAKQLLEKLEDNQLAKSAPHLYQLISSAGEEALEEFTETYADALVDAVIDGDAESWKKLASSETLAEAAQSALGGAAGGLLISAGAQGMGALSQEREASANTVDGVHAEDSMPSQLRNQPEAELLAALPKGEPSVEEVTLAGNEKAPADMQAVQEESANPDQQELLPSKPDGFATSLKEGGFAREGDVSAVEKAVESVESVEGVEEGEVPQTRKTGSPSQSAQSADSSPEGRAKGDAGERTEYAELETVAGNEDGTLRETVGLKSGQTLSEKQQQVRRELTRWNVSQGAAQTLSWNVPESVSDVNRYAAAVSSMYRLGQMQDVKTFDQALELAGGMKNLAPNTNYVLANDGGRTALQIAYTQGKGEMEAGSLGGSVSVRSLQGKGQVYYEGTLRNASEAGSALIELNAKATNTDAVLKAVLQDASGRPDSGVRAYVDTEMGRIFFGDAAEDVFGTVLHENWHWYNTLDAEGGRRLQEMVLEYLAKASGFETVDELIRAKISGYAQQGLTYQQAAEELVGDAWRGIFDDEASFERWVEFQKGQAEKNASQKGVVQKVMDSIRELLDNILSKAKEILQIQPDNRAAKQAQQMAEEYKRILQDAYFEHAEQAMENLRTAKENAATLNNEGAAEKAAVRYEIAPEYAEEVEQWDKDGRPAGEVFVMGSTGDTLQGLGARENDIYMNGDKINLILGKHPEMTMEEIKRIPEILDDPVMVLASQNKGRASAQNTRLVLFGSVKAQDGLPVLCVLDLQPVENKLMINDMQKVSSAYTKNTNPVDFVRGSEVLYVSENKKRTTVLLRSLGFQTPSKLQRSGSMGSITYQGDQVKLSGVDFTTLESATAQGSQQKKSVGVRFQLADPVEVNTQKDLVAVHNLSEQNLQEALELGGMPSPSIAIVKAQEGHTDYGPISLVFASESIDPMANTANRVYGSDAWTPTRPSVEYKVNGEAVYAFEDAVYNASKDAFDGKFAKASVIRQEGVGDASALSREELAKKLKNETAVQLAYLNEQGETVQGVYKTESAELDSFGNDVLEKLVELAGADEIRRSMEEGDWDAMEALADKAADALSEMRTHGKLEGMNRRWEKRIENLRTNQRNRLIAMVNNAYKMLTDTGNGEKVLDVEATRQEIRNAAPEENVEKWVYAKLEKVVGEKGIRNQTEKYTSSGKQRSFAQLHYAYTLENLVRTMNQQEARGQGTWGISAKTLMSTTTAEYQTLDEVRADKGRLQKMPEAEYNKLLERADEEIAEVISQIRSETAAHADNSFEKQEIIGSILMQAAQGKRTTAAIGKAFAKEGYTIGKDTAQMILNLYNDVAKIPTGYFEAKPQRAVGFDEVRAAILPDDASQSLIDSLKEKGVTVELYKAGDDAERTKLLNEVKDVRFQMEEQADRAARKNVQQQASRSIAEKAAALDTLSQFFGITRGVKVTQSSLESLASRWAKANASRIDRAKLARETRVLADYLKADGADMTKAQSLAETLAGEVLEEATYRNSALWDEYPDLHKLEYTVDKNGKAKAELVKQYGSWSEAVAEARRHGVTLRQQERYREANPAEMYESLVNDTRAAGGTLASGEAALWRSAAERAGVAGAMSMESTEWLDVLMNLHDAIKPKMMSRFADVAEYEDAKIELAGRMIGDIIALPELTDAQAIFEGIQQHNLAVAQASAGEQRAAEVTKSMRAVQKVQEGTFNQRLRENQRAANRNSNDPAMQQLRQNERAERTLNRNLETLGVDITNVGDLNEKLTVLRETYERELKAEKKRLKAERQEMLDEIRLDYKRKELALKEKNSELKWNLKQEMRRADKAEYQLIVQENEIIEWEAENQRKAEQWQETQAKRNAEAISKAQQQRDEDVAAAKQLAEKRAQKAKDAKKMEEVRRSIRSDAQKLNQMLLNPQKDKYVQRQLVAQAAEVAKLASETVLNDRAVARLAALESTIRAAQGSDTNANEMTWDWKQSKVPELIEALRNDLTRTKEVKLTKLHEQLADAEQLPYSEKGQALVERIQKRIRETEARTTMPLTLEQLRVLKAITNATLHVVRNANKTVSLAEAKAIEEVALGAAEEVRTSKGNSPGGKWDSVHRMLTKYQLDMLGAKRVFRMLGGYATNGQMEMLADALNDGQLRQTEIQMGGEKLFANVTGKENLEQIKKFAGPGAEMVDLGIGAQLNHAQMCSLYMHLKNKNSQEHLMRGGIVIPDMKLYNKGDIEGAYQKGRTVNLGNLFVEGVENPAGTIIERIENAMTDYDRAWCADMETFFGEYTTNLINETSMKLLGYQRATEKNYYPIAVDKSKLASQVEGVIMDATIEGRGFLKSRQKSGLPILLEECQNVVQRSLKDTAAYAGLAAPIRDVQKVLNAQVQTANGTATLKNGLIKEHWGGDAVSYIDDLLTDLQTVQRKRSNGVTRVFSKVRGNYAGAVLTLNPGVAIAQAASLPTAAAVLGSDTMAAVVPFVQNFSAKQRAAVEAEIAEHSPLLAYRLKGSGIGELASIGKKADAGQRVMDALPKELTGWITGMDEITVAALWEGSKSYVQNHAGEFAPEAATVGSEDYWDAVAKTYQKVIEETQPNYTTMQRSGIQRNPDELVKSFTAFTTQRFQNYGILADAVGEYRAKGDAYEKQLKVAAQENVNLQQAQERVDKTRTALEEAKAELEQAKLDGKDKAALEQLEAKAKGYESGLQSLETGLEEQKASAEERMEKVKAIEEEQTRAKKQLKWALGSQVVQTAVFAAMKIGADFLLHRWDRERDENGDVTILAIAQRFASLATESAAGNFLFGTELYSLVDNLWNDGDYDVVSVSSISALNEIASAAVRFSTENGKDTAEMTETELEAHHAKLKKYGMNLIGKIMDCSGISYSNAKKIVDAAEAYIKDGVALVKGKGFSFDGAPESATGQYDRLYDAYLNKDADEAQAALGKLELLGKTDKVYSELKKRLRENEVIAEAARKTNSGDWEGRRDIINEETAALKELLGTDSTEVRDAVVGAVDAVANQMLIDERGGGKDATVYTAMLDELESGSAKSVQSEIDRLLKAGKTATNVKNKITAAMKETYAAGSDYDRKQIEKLLTALTDGSGNALYTEKTIQKWGEEEEKEEKEDRYDLLK